MAIRSTFRRDVRSLLLPIVQNVVFVERFALVKVRVLVHSVVVVVEAFARLVVHHVDLTNHGVRGRLASESVQRGVWRHPELGRIPRTARVRRPLFRHVAKPHDDLVRLTWLLLLEKLPARGTFRQLQGSRSSNFVISTDIPWP
uniref:(northern house mosquito) hypothetical protein n=1 Tax=Culex pipiens TaxID=7175 RepID=A0A8D8E1T4_CULPI